jgi:hypothetical protein
LYQRPDAPHLTLDENRTSLTGGALMWSLSKQSGDGDDPWRYGAGGDWRSTELEGNDIGYQRDADQFVNWAWVSYRNEHPGGGLQRFNINSNIWHFNDLEPRLHAFGGDVNGSLQTDDFWNLNAGLNADFNQWEPKALRGGPKLRSDTHFNGWMNINSDSRKALRLSVSANASATPAADSWSGNTSVDLSLQARANLEFSIGPSLSVEENDRQYVDEIIDSQAKSHYIFARIRQVTTAMTLRVSWTLTPKLGFQLYAQPFVSTGSYADYKDADQPSEKRYRDRFYQYGIGDIEVTEDAVNVYRDRTGINSYSLEKPDFSFGELRSTAVLRWEYRPGSTVFAIWSHGQGNEDGDGRYALGRTLKTLSRADSEDIVMIKANYWFGL